VNEKKIKRPMLIICALEDRITPPVVVRQIYDKYKKTGMAEYKEYEDQAHWVPSQPGWRNIAKDVLDFIEKNLTKAFNSV
jgi:cephalosporin-C deacetylase-like acetyl esterase